MRKVYFIALLLIFEITVFAQKNVYNLPDSLIFELKNNPKNDKNRIEAITHVIDYQLGKRFFNDAAPFILEFNELTAQHNDRYLEALNNFYLTYYYLKVQNDIEHAFKLLKTSEQIYFTLQKNEKNERLGARIYILLGYCYNLVYSTYTEMYQCLKMADSINNELNDNDLGCTIENNISYTLLMSKQYKEAVKALKKTLSNPDYNKMNKYALYNNLGAAYNNLGMYDSSAYYFMKSTEEAMSDEEKANSIAMTIVQPADSQAKSETIDKINDNLDFILNNAGGLEKSYTLYCLSKLYHENKRYDDALKTIEKSIDMARKDAVHYVELEGLKEKNAIFKDLKLYKDFVDNQYIIDSVTSTYTDNENAKQLEQLQLKYQFKELEAKIKYDNVIDNVRHSRQKTMLYLIILTLVIVVLIMVLLLNRKKTTLKNKKIQEEALANELDLRNREMTAKALVQVQRKELLTDMIEHLREIQNDKKKMSSNIQKVIAKFEEYYEATTPEDFDYYFTQTHPTFYKNLAKDFPDLSQSELHLCAYIKLNLSTKEIATICNITPTSVRQARYRLKKSMGTNDSDSDLYKIISKY